MSGEPWRALRLCPFVLLLLGSSPDAAPEPAPEPEAPQPWTTGAVIEDARQWAKHVAPMDHRSDPSAVAVAVGEDGLGVVGVAFEFADPVQAGMYALMKCEEIARLAETGAPCVLYARGSEVVYEFPERKAGPTAASPQCLEDPAVSFYLLNAWIRVFRSAGFSYAARVPLEFEVALGPEGGLRELSVVRNGDPAAAATAGRAFRDAAPFGPLFGSLACLGRGSFRFPLDPDWRPVPAEEAPPVFEPL